MKLSLLWQLLLLSLHALQIQNKRALFPSMKQTILAPIRSRRSETIEVAGLQHCFIAYLSTDHHTHIKSCIKKKLFCLSWP